MGDEGSKIQKITSDFNVQIKFPDKAVENSGEAPSVVTNRERSVWDTIYQATKFRILLFKQQNNENIFRASDPNIMHITGKKKNCDGAAKELMRLVPITDFYEDRKERYTVRVTEVTEDARIFIKNVTDEPGGYAKSYSLALIMLPLDKELAAQGVEGLKEDLLDKTVKLNVEYK